MKNEDVFYRGDLDTLIFEIFKKQSFNNEGHYNQIRETVSLCLEKGNNLFWRLNRKFRELEEDYYMNKVDISTVAQVNIFWEKIELN
jgi:hypothetical protein